MYEEPKKANAVKNIDDMLWHRRLGHLNVKTVKKMVEDKQLEIIVDEDENLNERCKICIEAKLKRMKFPIGKAQRAKKPLELMHTDVKGKLNPTSRGGAKYFITFIDDYSRSTKVYFLKTKDEAFDAMVSSKNMAEIQLNSKLRMMRSDNGGEYRSADFDNFLKENGIRRQLTIPGTP